MRADVDRQTWIETWARISASIARRSLCSRAQVGAVVIDPTNRIVSVGYNGPPAGFVHGLVSCEAWCPRARAVSPTDREYLDCPALHAEQNALLAADRSAWQGGTIFVTSDVCWTCAKLIANSGLSTVILISEDVDRSYRDSAKSYALLRQCGVSVHRLEGAL